MCALWLSEPTCRVCLASDREMCCLANTPLEETYERVTSGTLVMEGRPCCVCGVCLSALRRCRRFIDTAREANDALDRWFRNHPNTATLKLTERPLFSFSQRATELIEITSREGIWELGVKQESEIAENEDCKMIYETEGTSHDENNILTEVLKVEVPSGDGNDYTHMSDDEADKTQMSDNIESHSSIYFKCFNGQEKMVKVDNDKQMLDKVKCDIPKVLDNVGGETAPGTSKVRSPQSRKRVKLNEDTESGPAIKKRRAITSEHRQRGNTNPAATLHKEGDVFSCRECNYKTPRKSRMEDHLYKHTGEKPYKCDKCDYKCIQKARIYQHLNTHDEKRFTCDKCDYKSTVKSYLIQHLITHSDTKPFACDKCDFRTKNKYNLRQHSKIHTGEKLFACNMCDYKAIQKSSLQLHIMNHSDCTPKLWVCNCQLDCKSKYLRTHNDKKPFTCDKCDFECYRIDHLNKHSSTHTCEKLLQCDKCDYRCVQKSILKQHLMIHTGEKPFQCDKCDFKCIQKASLKKHSIIHTGEKPFACDKCGYRTGDFGNYKRHLMQHTDEKKKFACNLCDYRAWQKATIKQHLRTHTGEKPFMCDKCYFKCSDKRHLIKHMVKAHAI